MKKLSIYLMLAIAGLFMAACENEDNEFVGLKTVEPEEGIVIPGFGAVSAGAVDLANYADGDLVTVFSLATAALPEGYTVENVRIYLHPTDDPANETKYETDGTFTKEELQSYVEGIYGKRPSPRSFTGKVLATVVDASGAGVLVDAGTITFTITPEAPVIAQNYYLVGGLLDWAGSAASKEQPFAHSDADVYDDPVFTYLIETTGETWFAIGDDEACDAIANSNDWSKLLGTTSGNGENGESGFLARRSQLSDDGSFKIADAGKYLITINMMDYTYTISAVASSFYLVGTPNGWNNNDLGALFFPEGNNTFSYTTYFTGSYDLKVLAEANLGTWDAYACEVDGDNSATGTLSMSYGGAIASPAAGYYTFSFDLNTMTYTWTALSEQAPAEYGQIGLIGTINGWDGDELLTQVTPHNWYIEYTITEANAEVKFRADAAWSVNWGADLTVDEANTAANGSQGGANILIPTPGDYRFYLNDITGKIIVKPVASEPITGGGQPQ